jgi:hypothetical protein
MRASLHSSDYRRLKFFVIYTFWAEIFMSTLREYICEIETKLKNIY